MNRKVDDVLAKVDALKGTSTEEQKEHTLREAAQERAQQPLNINAGTAFDWEEMEAYAKELERLDREGPGIKKTDR
jgi:hypothetical protein